MGSLDQRSMSPRSNVPKPFPIVLSYNLPKINCFSIHFLTDLQPLGGHKVGRCPSSLIILFSIYLLETGMILLILFLIWLFFRCMAIWIRLFGRGVFVVKYPHLPWLEKPNIYV